MLTSHSNGFTILTHLILHSVKNKKLKRIETNVFVEGFVIIYLLKIDFLGREIDHEVLELAVWSRFGIPSIQILKSVREIRSFQALFTESAVVSTSCYSSFGCYQ